MNNPLVSVIIPTYKQRGLLEATIESVLAQTYTNYEILVVDDNAPETQERKSTEDIMSKYVGNPVISYLKHEVNKNGAAARNTGFKASKGEYIAFLDDDDFWMPSKLEKQVEYLQNNSEFDCVYTYIVINGVNNPNKCLTGNIVVPYLMNYVSLQTSCLLFTRKSIDAINGFDESFRRHQDYELLIRFFLEGFQIGCIPEYISGMNAIGGNRMSGEKLDELKEKFFATFEEPLNTLDSQIPGIKKKIIVANYVKNLESHMAGKNYKLAWAIVKRYLPMSPTTFLSQCLHLSVLHIKRKLQK